MADLQLNIEYKTLPNRVLLSTMTILSPVWAILIPVALGLFIGHTINRPSDLPLYLTIFFSMAFVSVQLSCLGLTAFAEDKYIHISKNGIAFPLSFLGRLRAGRNRDWTEL